MSDATKLWIQYMLLVGAPWSVILCIAWDYIKGILAKKVEQSLQQVSDSLTGMTIE